MHYGRFFVTTAIDYVNSQPHIGHAYEKLAADVSARFWRKRGAEVFFLTGTDEHGLKIAQAARDKGLSPEKFVAEISTKFQAAWSFLNIKYDNFIRTTNPEHEKFVQGFVQRLYDNGEIYKDKYSGLYCIGCEEYKTTDELEENSVCPMHKKVCQLVEEDIYFFKLSKYQSLITEAIQGKKIKIEPEVRRNEIFQFLAKEPLKDLAISRSKVEWGIPVPWDNSQTIYVWVDALLNYVSGSHGFWPANLQLVGKDIFRFHAIIWPAMLMAAGFELPEKLFIHGFLTVDNQKMSKTIGNVMDPIELAKVYGVDVLRYFLFREVPFGQDGDFSINRFETRYRADLANDLGNLVQRILVLANKGNLKWNYTVSDRQYHEINRLMEELRFSDALDKIWAIITEANQTIDMEKPWQTIKENPEKFQKFILSMLDALADLASLIEPFMPETSKKIIDQLKSGKPEPLFPRK
jgi:methionyl-tRNA synthetase